jgi:hypothetical protein
LGDVYDHRLLFIIGLLWFGVWSILEGFPCGQSQFSWTAAVLSRESGLLSFCQMHLQFWANYTHPGVGKERSFASLEL